MTRCVAAILFLICAISADAKQTRSRRAQVKSKKPYCVGVHSISDCKLQGCAKNPNDRNSFDPALNEQKNRSDENSDPPVDHTIGWMKSLPDPQNFTSENRSRSELAQLGEGTKLRVVAWVLDVRHEGQETCNCGLISPSGTDTDTDNHIVLVDPALRNPKPECLECNSITAEFTPRVRLHHPNFTFAKLSPLIQKSPLINPKWKGGKLQRALLVRMTGYLMYDSHHFLTTPLNRESNWEIHPILKFEYCPKDSVCRADSNASWRDIEQD